jgi:hypothetical protein
MAPAIYAWTSLFRKGGAAKIMLSPYCTAPVLPLVFFMKNALGHGREGMAKKATNAQTA